MKHNNILHKAKILGMAAAFLCSGGVLTSCLDVQPQNEIIEEQFWNEKKDVESIIAGCYSAMQSYGMISRMLIWGEFRSENVTNNGVINDDVHLERLLKENIDASNGYTNWAEFYGIINRCNRVIAKAPEVAANDPAYTTSQLNAHIAEVTALRSLCYFYLIRTFRDVPYSEEPFIDDSQTLNLPATPFNEVLAKLIASLEGVKGSALLKYPENNTTSEYDYNCNRVTKQLIRALLCEMYLWQGNYDMCIQNAEEILAQKLVDAKEKGYISSDFQYFNDLPLIASRGKAGNTYGNAFNQIFISKNSIESIFELHFLEDGNTGTQLCNGPITFFYGGEGRATPFVKPSTYVANDERDMLYNVYAKENGGYDARCYENIMFSGQTPVLIYKYAARGGVTLTSSSTPYKDALYSQLWPTYDNGKQSRNKSNFIIYRLTDILLLKAEALTLKLSSEGTITETSPDYKTWKAAFDIVDAVNRRSLVEPTPYKHVLEPSNYNTKELLLDLVYAERNRELMFEGKRYYDLVRRALRENSTKFLASKIVNKDPQTAAIIAQRMTKIDAIFWPIFLDELKVNKNLHQNPAFGSGENESYE